MPEDTLVFAALQTNKVTNTLLFWESLTRMNARTLYYAESSPRKGLLRGEAMEREEILF